MRFCDFTILFFFKSKTCHSQVPVFRLPNIRIYFTLTKNLEAGHDFWHHNLCFRESPHITYWFTCLVSRPLPRAVSVVAIRMYFPSDAVLAISKEGECKPCNSAAVASRRSGESPSHEQGPAAELPADHQQLPQPCLFPCLSRFRLAGYYKCTGSVRK